MAFVRRASWVLVSALVLVVACKKDDPKPVAVAPSATASAATSASASAAPLAKAPPRPSKEKAPIPKAKRDAYTEGLGKGRKETLAKRYDAAIAAFDAALAALPGDPRALSERGYAKLLAGKTTAAREDFLAALGSTKDPKLLAQIHFNLGLVAEKLGHAEEAKVSFVRSNALAPSKAAAQKAGVVAQKPGPVCGALATFAAMPIPSHKSYKAVFDHLVKEKSATSKASDDGKAKELLLSRVENVSSPNVIGFPPEDDSFQWHLYAVAKAKDGGFLVAPEEASTYFDMPCGGEVDAKIETSGALSLVTVTHAPGMRVPVCENDAGELSECGENDTPVQSACGTANLETIAVVFDTEKKMALARVSFTADGPAPKIALVGRKLTVDGGGCAIAQEL